MVNEIYWLVIWNHGVLWLSICWECHHPNWRTHIFQRGSTTNQSWTKCGIVFFCYQLLRDFATIHSVAHTRWINWPEKTVDDWAQGFIVTDSLPRINNNVNGHSRILKWGYLPYIRYSTSICWILKISHWTMDLPKKNEHRNISWHGDLIISIKRNAVKMSMKAWCFSSISSCISHIFYIKKLYFGVIGMEHRPVHSLKFMSESPKQ